MIIFILQNSIILLSTYLLLKNYFVFRSLIDSLLAFFILFYAQIVFIVTLLGVLNLLYLNNIILFESFILLVLIFLTKRKGPEVNNKDGKVKLIPRLEKIDLNKIEIFCLSFILGFAIVKIMINLVNPPFGWDDLNYHFTFPVEWLKNGNLINPIVVSDYMAPPYYPINGSIIFFWLMLPFKSVFLADLGQLPFFIIAFLSVFSIARKLDINKMYALFVAVLFTLTPNYFKQLEVAYIDIMVAAYFFLVLNFFLDFLKTADLKSVILASLSLGMLIGTKNITLPYTALFFLFFLYAIFKNYHKSKIKGTIWFLVCLAVLPVFLGGFTYIRNFILTQNPFYPLDLKIFDFTVLRGVMDRGYPGGRVNFSLNKLLFHEGMGAGFIIFVIPGIILTLIQTLKLKKLKHPISFLFILIFALYLIYRYVVCLPNLRYLYPWISVCYIVAFFGIGKLKIPLKIIYFLLIVCLLASAVEIANHKDLAISLIITVFIFSSFSFLRKSVIYFMQKSWRLILICFFCLFGVHLLFLDYSNNEFIRYKSSRKYSGFWPDAIEAWIWLDNNTIGNNIAYIGRPVPFPLYGRRLKNNVYYISVNKTEPAKLHYFSNSYYSWGEDYLSLHKNLEAKGNYRFDANYSVWLNNLIKRNIDYLFIYSLHQTRDIEFPIEDNWAKNHLDKFKQVFMNKTIHVYKVLK